MSTGYIFRRRRVLSHRNTASYCNRKDDSVDVLSENSEAVGSVLSGNRGAYVRQRQCPCSVDLVGQAPNIYRVKVAQVQAGMAADRKAAFQQRLGPPENKYVPKKASLSALG